SCSVRAGSARCWLAADEGQPQSLRRWSTRLLACRRRNPRGGFGCGLNVTNTTAALATLDAANSSARTTTPTGPARDRRETRHFILVTPASSVFDPNGAPAALLHVCRD